MNDREDSSPRRRIIIVDDEAMLVEIFRLALSGRYEVLASTDPVEALELCRSQDVELLLTDYHMNGMHGITLIQKARSLRPALPCLLFSGNLTPESWAEALNAGCRHVIAKPLALRTVIDLCDRLLAPAETPTLPPHRLDTLESLPWQGTLGLALRALATHLLAGRNLIFLVSLSGPFPIELLHGLLPALTPCRPPQTPPPGDTPLYTPEIQELDAEGQQTLAALLAARRGRSWLLCADASPDVLLDGGGLVEGLYYRLGHAVVTLPPPADCPHDTIQLCEWLLASSSPPCGGFTPPGRAWLLEQIPSLNWTHLVALLLEARKHHPGDVLGASVLQRASLALSLGSDLSGIVGYAEFADGHTRKFRQAWDLLAGPNP